MCGRTTPGPSMSARSTTSRRSTTTSDSSSPTGSRRTRIVRSSWRSRRRTSGRCAAMASKAATWLVRVTSAAAPTGLQKWRADLALVRATRTLAEVAQLRETLEQACAEARLGDDGQVIFGGLLIYLAIARGWQGDRVGAATALDEAVSIDRRVGSEWSAANLDHVRRARPRAWSVIFSGPGISSGCTRLECSSSVTRSGRRWVGTLRPPWVTWPDARMSSVTSRASRELATETKDVALLCQLLRLEARALERSADDRSRAVLDAAAEQLEACGGIRAAAIARPRPWAARARAWRYRGGGRAAAARGARPDTA